MGLGSRRSSGSSKGILGQFTPKLNTLDVKTVMEKGKEQLSGLADSLKSGMEKAVSTAKNSVEGSMSKRGDSKPLWDISKPAKTVEKHEVKSGINSAMSNFNNVASSIKNKSEEAHAKSVDRSLENMGYEAVELPEAARVYVSKKSNSEIFNEPEPVEEKAKDTFEPDLIEDDSVDQIVGLDGTPATDRVVKTLSPKELFGNVRRGGAPEEIDTHIGSLEDGVLKETQVKEDAQFAELDVADSVPAEEVPENTSGHVIGDPMVFNSDTQIYDDDSSDTTIMIVPGEGSDDDQDETVETPFDQTAGIPKSTTPIHTATFREAPDEIVEEEPLVMGISLSKPVAKAAEPSSAVQVPEPECADDAEVGSEPIGTVPVSGPSEAVPEVPEQVPVSVLHEVESEIPEQAPVSEPSEAVPEVLENEPASVMHEVESEPLMPELGAMSSEADLDALFEEDLLSKDEELAESLHAYNILLDIEEDSYVSSIPSQDSVSEEPLTASSIEPVEAPVAQQSEWDASDLAVAAFSDYQGLTAEASVQVDEQPVSEISDVAVEAIPESPSHVHVQPEWDVSDLAAEAFTDHLATVPDFPARVYEQPEWDASDLAVVAFAGYQSIRPEYPARVYEQPEWDASDLAVEAFSDYQAIVPEYPSAVRVQPEWDASDLAVEAFAGYQSIRPEYPARVYEQPEWDASDLAVEAFSGYQSLEKEYEMQVVVSSLPKTVMVEDIELMPEERVDDVTAASEGITGNFAFTSSEVEDVKLTGIDIINEAPKELPKKKAHVTKFTFKNGKVMKVASEPEDSDDDAIPESVVFKESASRGSSRSFVRDLGEQVVATHVVSGIEILPAEDDVEEERVCIRAFKTSEPLPEVEERACIPAARNAETLPEADERVCIPAARSAEPLPKAKEKICLPAAEDEERACIPAARTVEPLPKAKEKICLPAAKDDERTCLPAADNVESLPAATETPTLPRAEPVAALPAAGEGFDLSEADFVETIGDVRFSFANSYKTYGSVRFMF